MSITVKIKTRLKTFQSYDAWQGLFHFMNSQGTQQYSANWHWLKQFWQWPHIKKFYGWPLTKKILLMPSTKRILWITPTIYFMNDPQPNFYYGHKIFFINGPYQTVSRMSLNKKIWIALNNRFLWMAPKFVDEWPQP